jgi:hypothetical protein
MTTASAVGDRLSASRRNSVAVLARAPRIPRRKSTEEPGVNKRAAVVLRRGMRPLEFRQVEEQIEKLGLTSLPVLPGQRKMHIADTAVCGLIVTGSDVEPSYPEREMIEEAVRTVLERGGPVVAFSDAAEMVLTAAGLDALEGPALAVLVHNKTARALTTQKQVEDAMKQMAKSPAV